MTMKPWHIIAGAMILGAIFMTVNRGPRGIRNNNPLNIERTNDRWQGMAEHQNDDRFLVFTDARYGYRAAARIVSNYQARGLKTLAQIVSTWAPSVENDTLSYINSVAKRAGIEPDQVVTDSEIVQLFEAMTWHENGEQPYSLDTIAEGVSWA